MIVNKPENILKMSADQVKGGYFLAGKNYALLADDMGVGKTAQAILACDLIHAKKILVICPAVARINWFREFDMWSLYGNEGFQILESGSDWPQSDKLICSFDYATEYAARLKREYETIIIDECHNIKEPEALRTVAIYGKEGLIRHSKRMWLLSGSPAPNNYAELWPMAFTFGLTKLSYNEFIKRYCNYKMAWHGGKPKLQIIGSKDHMASEITEMLAPMMMRRLKEDTILDLPPIKYSGVYIKPCDVELAMHEDFCEYVMTKDNSQELYTKLDAQRARLKDVVDTYGEGEKGVSILEHVFDSVATLRRYTGLQKINGVVKLVNKELENGDYHKIVIFCLHKDVIKALQREFTALGWGVVTLYGGTPPKKRQKNIDKFQTKPTCTIFIGQVQAAGVAITLTAAAEVLMVEWMFTPGLNAQAVMRVHRRTQLSPVRVRFATIKDSIDNKISNAYMRKARELTAVFGGKTIEIEKGDDAEGEEE